MIIINFYYKCLFLYISKSLLLLHQIVTTQELNSVAKETAAAGFRRICYYANWAPYRKIDPVLYPDNIDPFVCTHVHYAFARIDPKTLELIPTEDHDTNWTEKSHIPLYIRLYSLKRRNTQLKTLLAVGGWSAKSVGFNEATRNHTNRALFITQAIKLLRDWNFDGIDLDWEFPGDIAREADFDSKKNFNLLITDFREAIDKEAESGKEKKLLLSSAVAADPKVINNGYDVKNLCKQLDYVSVMTYDYHGGSWDSETGLNSPLYAKDTKERKNSNNETSIHTWKNINYTINYWISNGCDPSKLNLGLAAYGRSFNLRNSSFNKVGSPTIGKGGMPGNYTKEEGILSYFEICENILAKNWTKHWDDEQQSVYATQDDQWVGYDNERSITLKVKWALSMSLGGTMLWTLDFDDYSGRFCNQGAFPIASTIWRTYEGSLPATTASSAIMLLNSTSSSQTVSSSKAVELKQQKSASNSSSMDIKQSNYSSYNVQLISNDTLNVTTRKVNINIVNQNVADNMQTMKNSASNNYNFLFSRIIISFILYILFYL